MATGGRTANGRADRLVSVRARMTGRVQGVGFRYWAESWAARLELAGYARNLTDGGVDAVFCGARDAVARMVMLCAEGPDAARVDQVDTDSAPEGWDAASVEAAGGFAAVGFRRVATADPEAPPPEGPGSK